MAQVALDTTADFTGGINLRADQFKISDNQSPWLLNMEVDPAFGVRSRKGWIDWATVGGTGQGGNGQGGQGGQGWDPRSLYSHVLGDGAEWLFLASDGDLWANGAGNFVQAAGVAATADPHGADFAPWGSDLYVACGRGNPGQKWSGGVWTALTDAASNWSNDYTAPVGGQMPEADFAAIHDGYMWVANTLEGGSQNPHRIRFSHPNDPDSWALLDYIDFPEGGGPITGITPYRDHLLVFFPSAVWALYGSNRDTFAKANVTKTVGAANRQCLTRSENAVYFTSWPDGVYKITADSVDEVSESLRPAFKSGNFNTDPDNQWLCWANQKLFWSVPYDENGAPSAPTSTFVYDPSIDAWVLWRAGDGRAVAPITGSADAGVPLGCSRVEATVLKLDALDAPTDVLDSVNYDFPTVVRTSWQDSGMPTIKKRWKRPDIIVRETDTDYVLTMHVFHNLQETGARRTRQILFTASSSNLTWDNNQPLLWDDDSVQLWGTKSKGSSIERAGGLGSTPAVQLEFHGESGKAWGLNGIVYKSIVRRIR
jgi:hypothetical protein